VYMSKANSTIAVHVYLQGTFNPYPPPPFVSGATEFSPSALLPLTGETLGRLLALASYLPLCGDGAVEGDGITPLVCAHLEGADQREVNRRHKQTNNSYNN